MFVATLKNSFQTSLVVLLVLCLLLWGLSFQFVTVSSAETQGYQHILFDFLFSGQISAFSTHLIILASIVFGAAMINFLTITQEIASKTNYLPAFLYILFGFSASVNGAIEPVLVANLCLLPALFFIINAYRQENILSPFFNAGLFLGLSTFFYTFYVFLFPVVFIALLIMRSFNWREWLMLLIGILSPLYLYTAICYLENEPLLKAWFILQQNLSSAQLPALSEYYSLYLFIVVFVFVLSIVFYLNKGFGNKIKTTKSKFILLWMLVAGIICIAYTKQTDMIFLPFIISLSVLLGDYLGEIKQLKIANTLLFLIIAGFLIIYSHALGFF